MEPARPATEASWSCHACGARAGSIALVEDGLRRATFTGTLSQPHVPAGLTGALAAGDAGAVFAIDPELAPWWCPDCEAAYCERHWLRWDVFDEELPHMRDSLRGRCPAGHERMLED